MSGNKRVSALDANKAILIMLVVVGHLIQYTAIDYSSQYIYRLIYSFHMPLFFVLSGMSVYYSKSFQFLGYALFSIKSFFSLLLPYLIWSLFLVLMRAGSFKEYLYVFADPFYGFWFLDILFWSLLLARLVIYRGHVYDWILFAVLLGAAELFSWFSVGTYRFKHILYYTPFVIMGHYTYRWLSTHTARGELSLTTEKVVTSVTVPIVCFVAVIVMAYGWNYGDHKHILENILYKGPLDVVIRYLYRFTIVVLALLFFISMIRFLHPWVLGKLVIIGRSTLEVYVLHLIVIEIFSDLRGHQVLYSAIVIALTITLVMLSRRLAKHPLYGRYVRYSFGNR